MITLWRTAPNFLNNESSPSSARLRLWAICVRALSRCSTTSAAVRHAVAKPTLPSSMALSRKSASPGTGKSTTQSVRADEVVEVRQQLKNYHHLRDLGRRMDQPGPGVVAAPASPAPGRCRRRQKRAEKTQKPRKLASARPETDDRFCGLPLLQSLANFRTETS
jgi:hypothetical protein